MIGPLLLALSIIAISFWDKIVHKCKFKRDELGDIVSYKNVKSNSAVFEATIILFSFLVSIGITVIISAKRIKRRARG